MLGRLRRRITGALDRRFWDLRARIDFTADHAAEALRASTAAYDNTLDLKGAYTEGRAESAELLAEVRALRAEVAEARNELRADIGAFREHVTPVLRALVTGERLNRERLVELRRQSEYAEPFDHPDPLVTVVIPTHDRAELLTQRSLPSVLAQTHRNLEVIVVGDAAPPHVEAAVRAIDDERVRFINLTQRHAVTDASMHWMVGSVPARNTGYAAATGHWIVDFDDDDAMRPDAIERTLALARAERHEVVYGKLLAHFADGHEEVLGRFPPTVHQFGWQCSVVHRGLWWLGRDTVAIAFGHPQDWFRIENMMRVGVRIGMVDGILYDYYPARSWDHMEKVPENASIEEHAW